MREQESDWPYARRSLSAMAAGYGSIPDRGAEQPFISPYPIRHTMGGKQLEVLIVKRITGRRPAYLRALDGYGSVHPHLNSAERTDSFGHVKKRRWPF